ncbi:MAG: sn-glycerol-3-phosphate ABC transporter ATP-binding protein UgpC [Bacteroidetes bacterium]|nr:sn-glycerol-3-phosphate ABC transporter ATP-binding protein UgpC [Bacteroidota bacterium]MCL6100069.1 sn-glycerol-3-phosphate ABC transporter ATP-binding protein UgpC [Bacteroidota bacterium]
MAEVKLVNVSKIYEEKNKAVSNVNLEIGDKEFVVLVGPSGCGKSTTLRMIAGLEEISEGEIFIDGKKVNSIPPKDRDIAMVFQNYALYPHMSVYENMAFGLKLRKFGKSEIKERVSYAAKILDIEHLLERKPKQLSGGQRQRVAVGRAIVRKPKVFLFDEPLSNLDAKLRVQMRSEIARLHKRLQTTIVYVTHDQVEAMTMGDRIVVMKDGIVQQVDTPLNLYNFPKNKFVAGFIGSPAMNFVEGKIANGRGLEFESNQETLKFQLNPQQSQMLSSYLNKEIAVGIRPESFNSEMKYENSMNVKLEFEEQMGNEVYLHFNVDGKTCIARVRPETEHKIGDEIKICFNSSAILFFDNGTGERIC